MKNKGEISETISFILDINLEIALILLDTLMIWSFCPLILILLVVNSM